MDSHTLLQQGIAAVRKNQMREGRRFIKQALRLNPGDDTAWVWLARTETEPDRKRGCLEQALTANPNNFRAQQMLARLSGPAEAVAATAPTAPKTRKAQLQTPSDDQEKELAALLKMANKLKKQGDLEGAVEQWVYVLRIQVDHEEALRNAVAVLNALGHYEDGNELAWRAINVGSKLPYAYQVAMRFARHRDRIVYDELRHKLLRLPTVQDYDILRAARQLVDDHNFPEGLRVLEDAIARRPDSQELLIGLGDMMKAQGNIAQGLFYFNQAARIGPNKEVEKRLAAFPPILTDRERGSVGLALREVVGISIFYLLLAWQDVGLDLFNMDLMHGLGVSLSAFGGYLLVTGTSSPQQKPLAGKLGGLAPTYKTDAPIIPRGHGNALEEASTIPMLPIQVQVALALVGISLLVVAFGLVFGTSVQLVLDFRPY